MRTRLVFGFLVIASSPATADVCADLIAASAKLKGGTPLVATAVNTPYKKLYDDCDSNNRFAGRSLPTHNGKGLTCSGDPNRVAALTKYPDGTIAFNAKGSVDADGSRFACGDGWPNQCGTWLTFDQGSQRHDVNAEDTPFVVVPIKMQSTGISFQDDTGIRRGDIAVAYTNGKCTFGVVGDAGPYFRLGELSLKAHAELGHPRCKVPGQYPCTAIRDSSIPKNVNYLIFPGTRPAPLTSQNVNEVSRTSGRKLVAEFLARFAQ